MGVNKSRKRANKRAGKRATAPTINPQPVVRPIVPGGHKETVGTDRCPVEECPVTFSSKNNERAITIHVKAIVKKGRAYYADKKKGVGLPIINMVQAASNRPVGRLRLVEMLTIIYGVVSE
jgi:hypothetical protein